MGIIYLGDLANFFIQDYSESMQFIIIKGHSIKCSSVDHKGANDFIVEIVTIRGIYKCFMLHSFHNIHVTEVDNFEEFSITSRRNFNGIFCNQKAILSDTRRQNYV
jgi:hypothetical protein